LVGCCNPSDPLLSAQALTASNTRADTNKPLQIVFTDFTTPPLSRIDGKLVVAAATRGLEFCRGRPTMLLQVKQRAVHDDDSVAHGIRLIWPPNRV
jgi:hypothetical protein